MKVSEFEFPATVISNEVPNDVVFCGKVITLRTEPGSPPQKDKNRVLVRSQSSSLSNGFMSRLRSQSRRENRFRRSESSRKAYNGMFGTVKFPLQMELSEIKMRQHRREPPPPPPTPRFTEEEDGGESCWELVRPLKRGGMLKNAFFGCFLSPSLLK